jgi:tetratricopeptide (TPR) repeat protein
MDPVVAANSPLYLDRGKAFAAISQWDKAIRDFTTYLKVNPRHSAKAAPYLQRGRAYGMKRKYRMAIYDLNIAIAKDSKNADAYSLRGLAYRSEGKYAEAIADFNKAIAINPEAAAQAGIYFERGRAYAIKGQYKKSIPDLTIAIENNPNDADAHFLRGVAYQEQFQYKKSIHDLAKTIEIDPGYANAYNRKAWILATCPQAGFRNGDQAIELAQKAVALDRDETTFLDTLAAAYAEAGQFDKAITTQREVIAKLKKDGMEKKLIIELTEHLKSYESNKPWRDK